MTRSRSGEPIPTLPIPAQQWTHLVGVVEDLGNGTSAIRLYVNGNLESEVVANTVFDSPSACRFYIGNTPQNECTGVDADEFSEFRDFIDDPRVYSDALSAAEVDMLYNATPE